MENVSRNIALIRNYKRGDDAPGHDEAAGENVHHAHGYHDHAVTCLRPLLHEAEDDDNQCVSANTNNRQKGEDGGPGHPSKQQ